MRADKRVCRHVRRLHDDIPETDPLKVFMRSQKEIFPSAHEYERRQSSSSESSRRTDSDDSITPTTDSSFEQDELDQELSRLRSTVEPGYPFSEFVANFGEELGSYQGQALSEDDRICSQILDLKDFDEP